MSSEEKKNFDIKNLKSKVKTVSLKIKELVEQKKTDVEIEVYFMENDSKFYEEYPYLIKKLIKGGSLEFLDIMLNNLEKVEEGKQTLASTELKLGQDLANKYLYPKVNKTEE
tara:strand:- start:473 stop:808 length:336 start_codon:yes stop_codon:yes gene_type:complete